MAAHQVSHIGQEPHVPFLLPLLHKVVIIGCPKGGCTFTASARNEGRVIRSLAAHIVKVHSHAPHD